MSLDEVKDLTAEEWDFAELIRNRKDRARTFTKCRYGDGGIFYLVTDDNGGFQADTLQELKEIFGGDNE
jgi:hypothetical protein